MLAQANLVAAGSPAEVEEVVADKGYHDNRWLAECAAYIPEHKQKVRRWVDKPVEYEVAFRANHRRARGRKGRRLNRWRSERCERTFAHVCEARGRAADVVARAGECHQGACAQVRGVQPGLVAAQTLRVDQAAQRPRRGGGPLRPREVNANNSGQIGFC